VHRGDHLPRWARGLRRSARRRRLRGRARAGAAASRGARWGAAGPAGPAGPAARRAPVAARWGPAAVSRVPRCTSCTSRHATCGAAPRSQFSAPHGASPRSSVRRFGPPHRRRFRRHGNRRAAPRSRRGPPPTSSQTPPSTCLVARRRQVKGPSSGPRRGRQASPQCGLRGAPRAWPRAWCRLWPSNGPRRGPRSGRSQMPRRWRHDGGRRGHRHPRNWWAQPTSLPRPPRVPTRAGPAARGNSALASSVLGTPHSPARTEWRPWWSTSTPTGGRGWRRAWLEDLDRRRGRADLDRLADQLVRYAIDPAVTRAIFHVASW
jgi:hypothetical protein